MHLCNLYAKGTINIYTYLLQIGKNYLTIFLVRNLNINEIFALNSLYVKSVCTCTCLLHTDLSICIFQVKVGLTKAGSVFDIPSFQHVVLSQGDDISHIK